jgi:heptaprenyl diphosphate synthase
MGIQAPLGHGVRLRTTRDDRCIAWLAALAISIHVLESAMPSPVPGIKPGLANVITTVVLVQFGWGSAAWVSLLRVLCGSMILGTFLSPTFLLSISGAVCGIAILGISWRLPAAAFGPIGYSLLASLAHMAGQFSMAYTLFIPHPGLLRLLPLLMTAALIFGLISGIIAASVLKTIQRVES